MTRDPRFELPNAEHVALCGSCGDRLETDDDGRYECADCRLVYTSPDGPPEYMYAGAAPCGELRRPPVIKYRAPYYTKNGVVQTYRDWTTVFAPCALPEGHESMHTHPEHRSYVTVDAADIKED